MEYTADFVGQKVREINEILYTLDQDELVSWISDIIMNSSQKKEREINAIKILDTVKDELDWR